MAKKRCPAKHCSVVIGEDMAFCRSHWFMLPAELRSKIWRLFRAERGSMNHLQALSDARKLIEEKEAKYRPKSKGT